MKTQVENTAELGEVVAAAFDTATGYSRDPRVVARLVTQVVAHLRLPGPRASRPRRIAAARSRRRTGLAILLAAVLLAAVTPFASGASTGPRGTISLALAPGASLELDGNSTLHRYSAKAGTMRVDVGIDSARVAASAKALDLEALIRGHFVNALELSVPVDQLSSGEHGLDVNMWKALKADQYDEIRFWMDSYEVRPAPVGSAALTIVLSGRLSLAGVERKIQVTAAGVRVGDELQLAGSKELLMTDYQIKPPTMFLGTIKTADLVTVKFTATLRKGGGA